MSGTLLDFMETQISPNPTSSSIRIWENALSTSASGVGWPYFSSRLFSRLPPFTPMRMGIWWRRGSSLPTARTWASPPMLPGLMRILAAPAFRRGDGKAIVKVDIRHERQRGPGRKCAGKAALPQPASGTARRAQLTPSRSLERGDLGKAALHVRCRRCSAWTGSRPARRRRCATPPALILSGHVRSLLR